MTDYFSIKASDGSVYLSKSHLIVWPPVLHPGMSVVIYQDDRLIIYRNFHDPEKPDDLWFFGYIRR